MEKQKEDQTVPSSRTETCLQCADSFATSGVKVGTIPVSNSESPYLAPCQLPCVQYSADLEAGSSAKQLKRSRTESKSPVTEAIKAEPHCETGSSGKKLQKDLDCSCSPAHHHETVNMASNYDETLAIRHHAREIGLEKFLQESFDQHLIPLQTLCTAFGVLSPTGPSDTAESGLRNRLKKAIAVDMANRIKLHEYNTVKDAITLVRNAKNIMLITGAGISTSLNIPDFRSRGGLYSTLKDMGFDDPESVFSRDTFEQDPRPFFSVASMILPPIDGRFTPAHAFIRLLQDKGKLLTLYTQNIDGIDLKAGIRSHKLVQLHGSFETATCVRCARCVKGEEIFPQISKGEIPNCARCAKERQMRVEQMITTREQHGRSVRRKTQRSIIDSSTDIAGIMRPDIVFMGEPPRPYLKRFKRDCAQVDLLIVMGTSLPVEPVNTMPNLIPPKVPQIYIGKTQMYPGKSMKIDFDIQLLGDCDVVTELLAKGCGFDLKHEMILGNTVFKVEPWYGTTHCHRILLKSQTAKRKVEEPEFED